MSDLKRILYSIRLAAIEADVRVVCGDTKVLGARELDGIIINTAGIGEYSNGRQKLSVSNIRPGDAILVSGQLGNHAIQVLSMQEGLGFESRVISDCAPMNNLIMTILDNGCGNVHFMRDLTRGGLGGVLNEVASESGFSFRLWEEELPIMFETKMACDLLGLDPIYLANEGCLCLFVAHQFSDELLSVMRQHKYGKYSQRVGTVSEFKGSLVSCVNDEGLERVVPPMRGRPLPRLC